MAQNRELPYEFDLFFDIKTMQEVEDIATGKPHSSDAEPEELLDLFIKYNLDIPDCLKNFKSKKDSEQTIWILPNGTWLDYEPLENEYPNVRKVVITKF